jgi:hypothetical protein
MKRSRRDDVIIATVNTMKNILPTALVAIVGLAFVGAPVTAQAQTPAPATAPAPAAPAPSDAPKTKKKMDSTPYAGTIATISATSVTVTTKKDTLTLAIGPDTKFMTIGADKKKTPAAVTDFAVGDAVTGSYKKAADGSMTAASVHKKLVAAK